MTLRTHVKHKSRLAVGLGLALALAALAPVAPASAAVTHGPGCSDLDTTKVTCDSYDFYAVSGTKTMPNGASVAVMGYSDTAGGPPLLPGPAIVADAGHTVTVTLHNTLTQRTGMLFQEQTMRPDTTGIAAGGDNVATPYTFVASQPGTYLYEASPFVLTSTSPGGGGSQYQAAMGMYGALVVRPVVPPGDPAQAYNGDSAYNAEHLVVVGELDAGLTLANADTFDMRDYSPEYFLVNGTTAPATNDLAAEACQNVLLRMVNGGVKAHSMALLGLEQSIVGEDGNALANPRHVTAETMASGQTSDVIVNLSPIASGRYPVYDAGLWFNNNTSLGTGGMLVFLNVTPNTCARDTTGPRTTNVAFALSVAGDTGVLTATVSDLATGGANVTAAEYFIDTPPAGPSTRGTAITGFIPSPTVAVTATINPFPRGPHTIYVRGKDALGNWGPVSSVIVVNYDTFGPLTKSLTLSPNPSNGTKDVRLGATGDDSATGGSNIAAGEYTIDGGTPVPLTPNVADPVAALDATISAATVAALAEGSHVVSVRSKDSAANPAAPTGNWGDPATIALLKDVTGPDTGAPTASPAVVSGTANFGSAQQFMQVTATITDPDSSATPFAPVHSNVAAGEGFIDAVGADGTGFILVPTDGVWDSPSESVRGDVALDTLAALPDGDHPIYLHGRDASGNWGVTNSVIVTVDPLLPPAPGLNPTPLTIARSNVIFRNGFENGEAAAATTGAGRLAFVRVANMAGTGRLGMRVTLSGRISPATPASAYVTDNSPAAESTYNVRFYFNPNNSTPGGGANGITILAAYTATNGRGSSPFTVRYRLKGTARQVRLSVASGRSTKSTRWFTVPKAAATPVEVSWQAGASTTATLSLKGAISETLIGLNTGNESRIESVRFGVQGLSRSTSGRRGSLYLDSFGSNRHTVVGP